MEASAPTLPWYPWPGQGWPASTSQELAFVDELIRRLKDPSAPLPSPQSVERSAYTAVLNALRGGAKFTDMLKVAPNLNPEHLLAAYHHTHERLVQASSAYELIASAASQTRDDAELMRLVSANLSEVGRVLPRTSERLTPLVEVGDTSSLRLMILNEVRRIAAASDYARSLETALSKLLPAPYRHPACVELGQRLYSPYSDSAYTNPHYLPDRLAAVDAVRAKLLLFDIEEDVEEDSE